MVEREISISPMFKWLTKRFDKKGKKKGEKMWKRESKTVKKGLGEEPVAASVNDPVVENGASLDPLPETTVTNDEQLVISLKMKAQQEAEAEAAKIISQAKQEVQEIKLSAEIATEAKLAIEKEAEDILSTVRRKTEIIETEAKQRTLLYLLKAREEIEKQIREDYKRAYSRLSSSLQDLMSEGQNIEVELKNKRTTLWESKNFELKEYEAALLGTSEATAPPLETSASTETEIEPDIASKEEMRESAPLREEAPEEEIEQPVQLQEEVSGEKTEEPGQFQEEASEEGVEQPVQLQEEATEKKTEQPTQLQEETPVSEAAEETTEEFLRQHPLEKILGKEEANSTQLKPGDSQTLYTGEVELAIAMPVELKMVSKLYGYLQTIPDIKILRTTGSWDRGTTITIVADKPIPLISRISEIPGVEVTSELLQEDSLVKGTSSSLRRAGGKGVKGVKMIKLTLKEAQSP